MRRILFYFSLRITIFFHLTPVCECLEWSGWHNFTTAWIHSRMDEPRNKTFQSQRVAGIRRRGSSGKIPKAHLFRNLAYSAPSSAWTRRVKTEPLSPSRKLINKPPRDIVCVFSPFNLRSDSFLCILHRFSRDGTRLGPRRKVSSAITQFSSILHRFAMLSQNATLWAPEDSCSFVYSFTYFLNSKALST